MVLTANYLRMLSFLSSLAPPLPFIFVSLMVEFGNGLAMDVANGFSI